MSMLKCQNDEIKKLLYLKRKMTRMKWLNDQINVKMTKFQNDEMLKWLNIEMLKWQNVKMTNDEMTKWNVKKMKWKCHNGEMYKWQQIKLYKNQILF